MMAADGSVEVGLLLKGGMRRLLAELKWKGERVIRAWVREYGS
jgi:hypothetical protein